MEQPGNGGAASGMATPASIPVIAMFAPPPESGSQAGAIVTAAKTKRSNAAKERS
jgi:hypothetical protein